MTVQDQHALRCCLLCIVVNWGATARSVQAEPETSELGVLEGDILVHRQMDSRKATVGWGVLWPAASDGTVTVPYTFGFGGINRALVRKAIRVWTDNTCLQFQEVEKDFEGYHLIFISSYRCASFVGRTDSDGQAIYLTSSCLTTIMQAVHEIGHALGFRHEQSRMDRDNYVEILEANIKDSSRHNFNRYVTYSPGIPYDLASIMHYGTRFFSKNGAPTIVSKDPLVMPLMGNREYFTFWDIKLANLIYKCTDRWREACDVREDTCFNDGYVNSTCTCVCRDGTSGELCENVHMGYQEAMVQKLSPDTETVYSPGLISTPGYPRPPQHKISFMKMFIAPPHHKVRLVIHDLQMRGRAGNRCVDYLAVYTSLDSHHPTTACGSEIKNGTEFYSIEETMLLEVLATDNKKKGFSGHVFHVPRDNTTLVVEGKSGGCPLLTTDIPNKYLFQSPFYPEEYGSLYTCSYQVSTVTPSHLRITALDIKLGFLDFVTVHFNILDFFSFRKVDEIKVTPTPFVSLMFLSAPFSVGRFNLQIEVLNPDCHELIEVKENSTGELTLPSVYEPGTTCEWWLVAPNDTKICLTMEDNFYIGSNKSCFLDFGDKLVVNRWGDRHYGGFLNDQLCGKHDPTSLTSVSNEMTILFNGNRGGSNSFKGRYSVMQNT